MGGKGDVRENAGEPAPCWRMSVVLANWGGGESPFAPEQGEYATPICLHERPTTHLPPPDHPPQSPSHRMNYKRGGERRMERRV